MKTKILRFLECVSFYVTLSWYKIVNNNKAVLMKLKREVESLPNKIWTDEDFKKVRVDDVTLKEENRIQFEIKRKRLVKSVMHIENKIRAYVRSEFGETSNLLKEFGVYGFFPKDFVVNSFNIVENQYWYRGKCNYLYFIDKLLDEIKVKDELKSIGFKGSLRFLLYLLILGVVYAYLFENNVYPLFLEPYLDYALKKILLFIMIALLSFLIVRFDEIKFIMELFFPVLLAYLSAVFLI